MGHSPSPHQEEDNVTAQSLPASSEHLFDQSIDHGPTLGKCKSTTLKLRANFFEPSHKVLLCYDEDGGGCDGSAPPAFEQLIPESTFKSQGSFQRHITSYNHIANSSTVPAFDTSHSAHSSSVANTPAIDVSVQQSTLARNLNEALYGEGSSFNLPAPRLDLEERRRRKATSTSVAGTHGVPTHQTKPVPVQGMKRVLSPVAAKNGPPFKRNGNKFFIVGGGSRDQEQGFLGEPYSDLPAEAFPTVVCTILFANNHRGVQSFNGLPAWVRGTILSHLGHQWRLASESTD